MKPPNSIGVVVIACVLLSGCTSMKTVDIPPDELQLRIRAGEFLKPGEKAHIFTEDGTEHVISVVSVDDEAIHGADSQIAIDDIAAVTTRKVSAGKTALLAGGAIGIWVVVVILIAPALILAAAAP